MSRSGYIFLLSVLFIGAIALATSTSLLLLGWASEQNGETSRVTAQAHEWARACIEHAILELRKDLTYAGQETLLFTIEDREGSCTIGTIGGAGNFNRTICVLGESESLSGGETTRRITVQVSQLFPEVIFSGYHEVLASGCDPQVGSSSSASSMSSSSAP